MSVYKNIRYKSKIKIDKIDNMPVLPMQQNSVLHKQGSHYKKILWSKETRRGTQRFNED